MLIDVAASPSRPIETAPITVVVDTLRAATSITTMLERGIEEVSIAETISDARRLKELKPEALLCGEEEGLPPDGFDYGNSPSELAMLNPGARTAILATSNGTPLLKRHAPADVLLVGCLRNCGSVADAAAGPDRPVLIACAGTASSAEPSLEDTFTAGAIVNHMIRIHEGFELTEGAQEAFEAFLAHEGDAAKAFAASSHAAYLRSIGFDDDLRFCAEIDASKIVPLVEATTDGGLRAVRLRS